MSQYLVSYDLNRPGQHYQQLTNVLVKLGGKRVLQSAWIVETASDSMVLCTYLLDVGGLDINDKLIVSTLDSDTSWTQNLNPQLQVLV